MQPLISVIVPVYNIKEYLPRCVASICAQTYRKLEILLVDDGSTDGTGELCDRLAETDGRIRVFHKENGGSSSARNLGIANAGGDYLGFVDSDDYIEPDMYERLLGALMDRHKETAQGEGTAPGADPGPSAQHVRNEGTAPGGQTAQSVRPARNAESAPRIKMAQIGRDEVAEDGTRLPDICTPPAEPTCFQPEEFLRELLLHKGDCSFCTKLTAKELFSGAQFPEGVLNEDFHLLVGMLPGTGGVCSLPGYGYHVCYRMGSNTRKEGRDSFSRVYADNIDNADMVYGMVKNRYPRLQKAAVRFGLFQRLDYLLHIPIGQMTRDNDTYRRTVRFIRVNWGRMVISPYLTAKNKIYLTLFAVAPRGIRRVHARWKGFD